MTHELEVVVTDPPFTLSSTTWEDSDVSTRYEMREIPGIDIESEEQVGGGKNKDKTELLNQIDYGNGPPTLQQKTRKLCYEFRDIIDDTGSKTS